MAAEVENPEPLPTRKPRRQCHFDPFWVQNDADAERGSSILLRKVHTNERASLRLEPFYYSWSKFNNVACCFDNFFL